MMQQQCLQAASTVNLRAVDINGRGICDSRQFTQNLLQDALHASNIILTLSNSRISEMSLSNDPVFMVLPKLETLNQTNNLSQ